MAECSCSDECLLFAAGDRDQIELAIEAKLLRYPSYVFCRDLRTLAFIDKDNEIVDIRGYEQEAVIYVDELPTENIRKDAFYIYEGSGYLYIDSEFVRMFPAIGETSGDFSYNDLADIPIINKVGSGSTTIVVSDLDSGCYCITGQYEIAEGGTTYITTRKIMFAVDKDETISTITKFDAKRIVRYTVDLETGETVTEYYITDAWIEEQGYVTENYLTQALGDLYVKIAEELKITKVSQLENDMGYLTRNDLDGIGDDQIAGLFN